MKTNLLVTTILLASILAACGTSTSEESSNATAASTTQVSALAINIADVVAIGKVGETSGLRLTGDDERSTVGLNAEGKIIRDMFSAADSEYFTLYDVVPADNSFAVSAFMPVDKIVISTDGTSSTRESYDATLPGSGKMLMADCKGLIRVKGAEASCLISNTDTLSDNASVTIENMLGAPADALKSLKADKLGNLYVDGYLKISSTGVVTEIVGGGELLGITDDGSIVIYFITDSGTGLIRLITADGKAKTLSTYLEVNVAGNYIYTLDGLYTSKGVKVEISNLQQPVFTNTGLIDGKIYGLEGRKLIVIDTEAKTTQTVQLAANAQIYASVFTSDSMFYTTLEGGVSRVQLGSSSGLRLAAEAHVETMVQGLDDFAIFDLKAVGGKVMFSGQSDLDSSYVTGVISGDQASQNKVDVKVTAIQAL